MTSLEECEHAAAYLWRRFGQQGQSSQRYARFHVLGGQQDPHLFPEVYRVMLMSLESAAFRTVFCGCADAGMQCMLSPKLEKKTSNMCMGSRRPKLNSNAAQTCIALPGQRSSQRCRTTCDNPRTAFFFAFGSFTFLANSARAAGSLLARLSYLLCDRVSSASPCPRTGLHK